MIDRSVKEIELVDENSRCVHFRVCDSFNKGVARYGNLITESLSELGCGRGIVVDKNNVVISGNKVIESAQLLNKRVKIVETSGEELVCVKRVDVDAFSSVGYNLSLVDNLLASKNLDWNVDYIFSVMRYLLTFDPRRWRGHECLVKELDISELVKDSVIDDTIDDGFRETAKQLTMF